MDINCSESSPLFPQTFQELMTFSTKAEEETLMASSKQVETRKSWGRDSP